MSRSGRSGWKLVTLLAVSALVLAACGSDSKDSGSGGGGQSGKTVYLGFVGALTGSDANLGINIRDGMKVAVDEENAKGGTQVAIKEFDTAGSASQASTIKDRFIGDQSVIGIVGPAFSGETKAVLPDIQAGGLPMISASATNKALPDVVANQTVFHRVIADDALQAAGIVAYLNGLNPKPTKITFVHDNSEYGKGLADDVEKGALAKNLPKAGNAVIDPNGQDYSSAVNTIKSQAPSHIFFGGYYSAAGRLAKQLKDAQVNAQFISGDGSLDNGFVTSAGAAAAEGARLTCPCNLALESSTGSLKAFYDSFKAKIGKEPGLYSPEAYDATKIFIKGIKEGGKTDRAGLLSYIEGFGSYEGVSKSIAFETNGNLKSKTFFVFQVKNGKIAPLQQIDVA